MNKKFKILLTGIVAVFLVHRFLKNRADGKENPGGFYTGGICGFPAERYEDGN